MSAIQAEPVSFLDLHIVRQLRAALEHIQATMREGAAKGPLQATAGMMTRAPSIESGTIPERWRLNQAIALGLRVAKAAGLPWSNLYHVGKRCLLDGKVLVHGPADLASIGGAITELDKLLDTVATGQTPEHASPAAGGGAGLHQRAVKILADLVKHAPRALVQVDIATNVGLERRTVRSHLSALAEKRLVYQPAGKRGGWTVTDTGLAAIRPATTTPQLRH